MAEDRKDLSPTAGRETDDVVGTRGEAAAGGGKQTPDQAAVTRMGPGGISDADRKKAWSENGEPGRSPPVPGGSSGGQSDRKASRGAAEGTTIAAGHSKSEREDRG